MRSEQSLARFNRADCRFWICSMWSINSENPVNSFGKKMWSLSGSGGTVQPLASLFVPSPCKPGPVCKPPAAQLCLRQRWHRAVLPMAVSGSVVAFGTKGGCRPPPQASVSLSLAPTRYWPQTLHPRGCRRGHAKPCGCWVQTSWWCFVRLGPLRGCTASVKS